MTSLSVVPGGLAARIALTCSSGTLALTAGPWLLTLEDGTRCVEGRLVFVPDLIHGCGRHKVGKQAQWTARRMESLFLDMRSTISRVAGSRHEMKVARRAD